MKDSNAEEKIRKGIERIYEEMSLVERSEDIIYNKKNNAGIEDPLEHKNRSPQFYSALKRIEAKKNLTLSLEEESYNDRNKKIEDEQNIKHLIVLSNMKPEDRLKYYENSNLYKAGESDDEHTQEYINGCARIFEKPDFWNRYKNEGFTIQEAKRIADIDIEQKNFLSGLSHEVKDSNAIDYNELFPERQIISQREKISQSSKVNSEPSSRTTSEDITSSEGSKENSPRFPRLRKMADTVRQSFSFVSRKSNKDRSPSR